MSCSDDDDAPGIVDLEAPVIGFAEGRDSYRPIDGEVRLANTDHMHVRFRVTDNAALGQVLVDIHAAFDGHTHGRLNNGEFELLNVKDIYSPTAENVIFRFPEGANSLNVDGSATDIYWGGPTSRVETNVLAGPYDFTISATDEAGNSTNFSNNSSYIATFYIQRPYAPVVTVTNLEDDELHGEEGQPLAIEGTIAITEHALASELAFVWVRLIEEDDHSHGRLSDEGHGEWIWGTSQWGDGMSGDPIPNGELLNLTEVFSGENAITLPNEHGHFELVFWIEDANGNVTREVFEVHVE